MPRVHINLHDIDEIEELEEQEDWEELLGLQGDAARRDPRVNAPEQRGQRGFREQRFGGGEALDRKRSERRKQVYRSVRRA
jgi:hypothetical protein